MKQKGKFVNGFAYKNIKSETGCVDLLKEFVGWVEEYLAQLELLAAVGR